MHAHRVPLFCLAALAVLGGCGGEDDTRDSGGGDDATLPDEVGFAADIQPIAAQACATCHTVDTSGGFGGADTHAGWLESSSTGLAYCEPGDLDASYGYLKIIGAQGDVGGGGAQMPTNGALSSGDVALFEAWVLDGCLP